MANRELENLSVVLWRRMYQTYTRFKNAVDQTLSEYGLTMEQYLLLVTIESYGSSMRITDIGGWLERSTNSISMLVDRMVKAGLLRRVRDRSDRRVMYLSPARRKTPLNQQIRHSGSFCSKACRHYHMRTGILLPVCSSR